jgi:hypothetical protein
MEMEMEMENAGFAAMPWTSLKVLKRQDLDELPHFSIIYKSGQNVFFHAKRALCLNLG